MEGLLCISEIITLAQYVKDLRFSKSSISFIISTIPNVFFMGIYIYPVDSQSYKDTDFGTVIDEINYWMRKGYLPYIGGDFNSNVGDLKTLSEKSLKWRYNTNADPNINSHSTHFTNVCEI